MRLKMHGEKFPIRFRKSLRIYFPERQWVRIRANGLLDRRMKKIRRGSRVVGISLRGMPI